MNRTDVIRIQSICLLIEIRTFPPLKIQYYFSAPISNAIQRVQFCVALSSDVKQSSYSILFYKLNGEYTQSDTNALNRINLILLIQ